MSEVAMGLPAPAVHRTVLVVDVASFGDHRRTIPEQLVVRDGVYRALRHAFNAVGIGWSDCDHEDRGDGLLALVPPDVPKAHLVDGLPRALMVALSEHNSMHPLREQIRLRMAVHAGEVSYDDHGVTGPAINLAFRLIDAPACKAALEESPSNLAIVVSPWFFEEVVRHHPSSRPSSYRSIRVRVKETDTMAWVTVADHPRPSTPDPAALARLQPEALVGRDAELSLLAGLVGDVVAGTGRAILVDGEPGIGKSALIRVACATAASRKCAVLWGSGDELGQALPLLPLLEALHLYDPSGNRNQPRRDAVVRLLRGEMPLSGADPVAAASEQILALVGDLCHARPVILVVDDLQWADRATLAVWTRLSRSIHRLRLLLIGITRPVPRSAELHALHRAASACVQLNLGPLSSPAMIDFLSIAVRAKPGADLIRLANGAAGNPLFLTELIDALHREDALRVSEAGVAELVGDGVPQSLLAAIENRLEFAAGRAGEVLRAAALLGVEFSVVELEIALNRRIPELCRAIDEARAAGVLRDTGENLAFRHPLIRQVLYEGMAAAVRTAWHLDAAKALAMAGAPVHRVARQLLCASPGSRDKVLDEWLTDWLVDAAPSLVAQSPSLAVELLRTAVSDHPSGENRTGVLSCRLADALFRIGDIAESERVATRTATVVTEPELLVDLQWTLTQCRAVTGRSMESLAALERTLAIPGVDRRHRARLLVLTARTLRNMGKVDHAVRIANQALAEAETVGDRWAIAWALHVLIIGSVMRGEASAALPLFDRAFTVIAGDATLADLRMLIQINRATALGDLNRYESAIAAAHEVCELAERTDSLVRLNQAHCALGELLFDVGRWDDALVELGAIDDDTKDPGLACCAHGIAASIYLHRERLRSARRFLEQAVPWAERIGNRVIGSLTLARSLEREYSGAPDEALAALIACLTTQAEEVDEMEDLLPDAVRLAVEIGDRSTATDLVEQTEKLMEPVSVPHRSAAVFYCRGMLTHNPDQLLLAADRYRDAGRPLRRAKALEAAAIAMADRRMTDARAVFAAADDAYRSLGARWDSDRLRQLLRRYGLRSERSRGT